MTTCDHARAHLGAVRDREALPDPAVDHHLTTCAPCRAWIDDIDHLTRALRLRLVTQPAFVDTALTCWDVRTDTRVTHLQRVGRLLLGVAALGCLAVGVLIAAGSAGHTHTGVTAHREVIILEVALAFGLACAAARPRTFLPGVLPILAVVAIVNIAVSLINLAAGNSGPLDELAHAPFILGLIGAAIIHRAQPITPPALNPSPAVSAPT
jgi:predicted anti-sigma-YlaC factor YlaD